MGWFVEHSVSNQLTKALNWIIPLGTLLLFGVALELVVKSGFVPSYIFPATSEILNCFISERETLFSGFVSTASASVAGLLLSVILGISIATLLSLSGLLRRAFYPYAIFFQTVPIIALAPVLVIWFGFGQPTVIASAFIVSLFPVIASTLVGLQSTDHSLLDLFQIYNAPKATTLFKLRIPFALPYIFSGLRIAAGLSVIGAVVGEFVGGGGLGSVVDVARTTQRLDLVFSAVLISSLIGLLLVSAVNLLSYTLLHKWHASLKERP